MADPKYGGIYAIENQTNSNRYVGSAVCLANRWKTHRWALNQGRHHCQHLQRAWTSYGPGSFRFIEIERVNDPALLLAREQYYLDTLKPEYNECRIAGSALGRPQSEKQRAAMVAFNKRQVFTPERLARMSEITRARWQDPQAREEMSRRISEGQRASAKHRAARQAIGERRRGRRMDLSVEERERRRESTKGLGALRWAKVRAARSSAQPSLWE